MVRLNFLDVCFHCGIMMRYASIDSKVFKQSKEEYTALLYQKSYVTEDLWLVVVLYLGQAPLCVINQN